MVLSCRVSCRRMFSISTTTTTTTTTTIKLASSSQDPADDHEQQRQDRSGLYTSTSSDSHVVIVMAALLCVLLCAMGISSLIRCALRWSRWSGLDSEQAPDGRRHGMKRKDVRSLPIIFYSKDKSSPSCASPAAPAAANHRAEAAGSEECAICLGDFVDGDVLRILPTCKHGFHIACIDAWLLSHSSCPTCRHNPIAGPMITDKRPSAISSMGTSTQMQAIANSVLVANPA